MDVTALLLFLLIGLAAGWIAAALVRGGGLGLIGNLVVGMVGALIGGHILGVFGMTAGGLFGSLFTAVLGAVVLLFLIRLIKRA
ncbi:MAG: GlsB/YeaQ/YmgE family stress response membrane protein [Rhodospirillales bacterium]